MAPYHEDMCVLRSPEYICTFIPKHFQFTLHLPALYARTNSFSGGFRWFGCSCSSPAVTVAVDCELSYAFVRLIVIYCSNNHVKENITTMLCYILNILSLFHLLLLYSNGNHLACSFCSILPAAGAVTYSGFTCMCISYCALLCA